MAWLTNASSRIDPALGTPKQQVQDILENLPEDASLEDIQYHIFVRQKIELGLADVAAGRVISHEEVQRRLAKWLSL
jgi:predicted transcriptional regulator